MNSIDSIDTFFWSSKLNQTIKPESNKMKMEIMDFGGKTKWNLEKTKMYFIGSYTSNQFPMDKNELPLYIFQIMEVKWVMKAISCWKFSRIDVQSSFCPHSLLSHGKNK